MDSGNNPVFKSAGEQIHNPLLGIARQASKDVAEDAKNVIDEDSEEEEKNQKFAPPPAYYKQFEQTSEAMAPPDLATLAKKDYFILY